MENEKPKIKPIAYNYGAYLGVLTAAGLIIQYVAGLERNWVVSVISIILTIIIYYYGIKTYKQQNTNYLSIKEAIKVGLAIAVIGGLIGAVYTYIHYSYIQPEFIEAIREQAYSDMTSQNPNMTEEQLATGEKMMNIFTSSFFMATMTLIFSLFFGLIISLITGAIMKKDDPSLA
ncbi:DUF4199 domain-containing protein [uncultured Psychroserpens sp.]|uniref:DUF4199 domain-containing protein n=1 Tax=uncultured Psychroserpens sp. TaxID=255436 RepID=UPI00262381E3|nr:DUF4199 domain-containing protein [uncultured Psychroserpens sp.]